MQLQRKWIQKLIKSLQLQIFITFISLPFLIGWGLPISLLTPISTLIFTPFLTLFLLLSSLIFFFEIIYVPNGILIWILEHTTYLWNICLNFEQRAWLIAFKKPPLYVLLFMPLIALIIIHNKKITHSTTQLMWLTSILIVICCLLKLPPIMSTNITIEKISCNPGSVTIISHNNKVILLDSGCLSSRASFEPIINYTLVPAIIKQTGSLHIDCLIIKKINQRIFEALCFLASKITIKTVFMPHWKGKIPYRAWKQFMHLKKLLKDNNGTIIQLSRPHTLLKTDNTHIFLDQHPTPLCYYDATYNQLALKGTVDNHAVTV